MSAADFGLLLPESVTPQPWANGRGTTRVLLARQTWRLSIAEISGREEFSLFPGQDRVLMPLADGRVEIEIGGTSRRVAGGEGVAFRGEEHVVAEPAGALTRVVNLMTMRDRASAEWTIVQHTGPLVTATHPTVVLAGDVSLHSQLLPAGTVLLSTRRRRIFECADAVLAKLEIRRKL